MILIQKKLVNEVNGAYDYGFRYRQTHCLAQINKMPRNIYAGWAVYLEHSKML